jgi:phosphatidylinositol glycan class P protein
MIEEEKIYNICTDGKKSKIHYVELYGFFYWNLTALLYLFFLIWCFVPTSILNAWGIYYVPNKYYAIAVPTWLFVTMFCIVNGYAGLS